MLFLSPGIVYWVPILLHWFDSNAVFIVDIQECANSSSEDGKKQSEIVHTHCISDNFQSDTRKKDKCLSNRLPTLMISHFQHICG